MYLEDVINNIVGSYKGDAFEENAVVDLKVLKEGSTFFESDIQYHCRFLLNPEKLEVEKNIVGEPTENADLVVYGKEDTIIKVLDGRLDPLQAFFAGDLRMEGNTDLAIKIANTVN